MKISKQLSKILIFTFFILLVQSAKAQEVKEIWSEIEKKISLRMSQKIMMIAQMS